MSADFHNFRFRKLLALLCATGQLAQLHKTWQKSDKDREIDWSYFWGGAPQLNANCCWLLCATVRPNDTNGNDVNLLNFAEFCLKKIEKLHTSQLFFWPVLAIDKATVQRHHQRRSLRWSRSKVVAAAAAAACTRRRFCGARAATATAACGGDDGAPVAFFSSFGSLGLLSSQHSVVCEKWALRLLLRRPFWFKQY